MHPDHDLEQFYTQSHLPGVPRPFHQLPPEERIDWGKRMEKAQFEAWAKIHHYDLTRCSHEPYAAYRSDLTNAALAGWRGANGESTQPNHYQQLLGVAYVVLGCLAANGVDIPVRFLDAFSDPESVENPLELLPCDFSPAQAVRAAVEAAALTDEQHEAIKYARSVMGSVSWETPDSIRAKAVLDALLTTPKEESC